MESREKLINRLKSIKKITTNKEYTYKLTHEYSLDKDKFVQFTTNIKPEIMSPLLAYIQFEAEEIDESYEVEEVEIVRLIDKYYAPVKSIDDNKTITNIDVFHNREYLCGSGIWELEIFKRDGLINEF